MANIKVPLLQSLRFRLIACVVIIEVVMLSILVLNNISIIQATHTDRLRDTANSMIQQIASTSGRYMFAVDYATLEDYISSIIEYKELSYIIIIDRNNNHVIEHGTRNSTTHPEIDTHPANVHDGIFDITEDIRVSGHFLGRVIMGFSLSLMDDAILKSRNRGITIAAIEIVLTIIVTIFIGVGLTQRLSMLSIAASEVEAGNYSVSVPTGINDEVGKTAASFNSMVSKVSTRTKQLLYEEEKTQQLLSENRLLIQKSLEVQEEERKNLSRELHDELGQCITAIQADAESIKDLSMEKNNKVVTSAEAILNVSTRIYEVVHSMMHRLRPNVLDNLGLIEALKDEIDAWDARHPEAQCIFNSSGELLNLGERINITLYRVVQECLTNISKHASATKVMISLVNNGKMLLLTIIDNGVGTDLHAKKGAGLGIIGMRERADALGGEFSMQSSSKEGTKIYFNVPLSDSLDII